MIALLASYAEWLLIAAIPLFHSEKMRRPTS